MPPKILFLSTVIGALGVITCVQAWPIEVVYAGDNCECPKKLDYKISIPVSPVPITDTPSEHNYRVECPLKAAKARVTYSFDVDVEEPLPKLPIPEPKLDIFAKIDRVTAAKQDCHASQETRRTSGCDQFALSSRYVLPESSAARITENLSHPNSLDSTQLSPNMPATSKIVAIFFKPSKQPIWGVSKIRNKRDISRIFTGPKKNQKRSYRIVKQYNKRLKDITAREEAQRRIRSRSILSNGLRPLQQLGSFLKLPRLRNKRDIKGEYDLIAKDREQMDLTLPEIIQYMPETLSPNFKRNQCNFEQSCRRTQSTETTTNTITTTMPRETSTTMFPPEASNVTDASYLKNEAEGEKQTDNDYSSMYRKRKARNNFDGGHPVVIDAYSTSPIAIYTYKIPIDFKDFTTTDYKYNRDPITDQYVGVPCNPYETTITSSEPATPPYSNYQLDRLIADILRKHSDFLEDTTQRDEALVDPTKKQTQRTLYFLKSLLDNWGDLSWLGGNRQQYPSNIYTSSIL